MEALGFIVIVVIAVAIIVKVNLSEGGSNQSYSQNTIQSSPVPHKLSEAEIQMELMRENANYANSVIRTDPIMYPTTKGAVSRMTEEDRNAYHNAVNTLKKRIETEVVPVSAFYQARNLDKYAASLLARAQKKNDIETAKHCAMNLFYSKVCMAACFSDKGTIPEMDLWLRDYGFICLHLSYFKLGRITGKRGGQSIEELWAGDYERIAQALDPDGLVKSSATNWRKIRDMAEGLAETASDTNGEGGNP